MKIDIIGGGIAGLSAAIELKRINSNIKVIVHEKNSEIGFNHDARKCGEGYSYLKDYDVEEPTGKSIFSRIGKIELEIGDRKIFAKTDKTYALNKPEFIKQIGKKAEKLGVEIYTNDKIRDFKKLDGNYIIDASGCPSFVKNKLGLKKGLMSIGYQQTIENSNVYSKNTMKFIFKSETGYYWIFPRDPNKNEVNVGVGVIHSKKCNLLKMLENFKKEYNIKGDLNYTAGGLIPLGLQRPFKYKNILFVGDTGAGTFPVWAEGNFRANLSGKTAAKCIANNCPDKYPKIINQHYIKWDIIGKVYIKFFQLLSKIGPRAYQKMIQIVFSERAIKLMFT